MSGRTILWMRIDKVALAMESFVDLSLHGWKITSCAPGGSGNFVVNGVLINLTNEDIIRGVLLNVIVG